MVVSFATGLHPIAPPLVFGKLFVLSGGLPKLFGSVKIILIWQLLIFIKLNIISAKHSDVLALSYVDTVS